MAKSKTIYLTPRHCTDLFEINFVQASAIVTLPSPAPLIATLRQSQAHSDKLQPRIQASLDWSFRSLAPE
jgi:hypothetical protein